LRGVAERRRPFEGKHERGERRPNVQRDESRFSLDAYDAALVWVCRSSRNRLG
jgi:hypothetical protein